MNESSCSKFSKKSWRRHIWLIIIYTLDRLDRPSGTLLVIFCNFCGKNIKYITSTDFPADKTKEDQYWHSAEYIKTLWDKLSKGIIQNAKPLGTVMGSLGCMMGVSTQNMTQKRKINIYCCVSRGWMVILGAHSRGDFSLQRIFNEQLSFLACTILTRPQRLLLSLLTYRWRGSTASFIICSGDKDNTSTCSYSFFMHTYSSIHPSGSISIQLLQ